MTTKQLIQDFRETFDQYEKMSGISVLVGVPLVELEAFLLHKLSEQREEIIEELKTIEGQKWGDAKHCSCLPFAINHIKKTGSKIEW